MKIKKKVIIVTGASRGIGFELTKEFLAWGATVFACARSMPSKLPQHENLYFTILDVRNSEEIKAWARSVSSMHSHISMLINNAGVINEKKPLWEISDKEFDRVLDINVKGAVNVLREFVPLMIKGKGGVIVNMSSGWGHFGDELVAPYCASKFAIEGLTQSLAKEVPKELSVVALRPGVVNTEMLQSCSPDTADDAISANAWAKKAVPFLLEISKKDSGQSLVFSR
jgi:NAD(P)-dependent dehydrogenase (short-subunit alcohol dehydrogenase family)